MEIQDRPPSRNSLSPLHAEGMIGQIARYPIGVPSPGQTPQKNWNLVCDGIYSSLLVENGALRPDFLQMVRGWIDFGARDLFRQSFSYRTVPLMAQIDPRLGEVSIYSWRGGAELFLEEISDDPDFEEHVKSLKDSVGTQPTDLAMISKTFGLPRFNDPSFQDVYDLTLENEKTLISHIKSYRPGFMERISDFSLDLTARYVMVRTHLLKFLAILPSLDHDRRGSEVKRIFLEAIRRLRAENRQVRLESKGAGQTLGRSPLPQIYIFPMVLVQHGVRFLPAQWVAFAVRASVRFMARRFIAGENIHDATESLRALRATGREATIDQLGELVVSEQEADHYKEKVLELIRGMARYIPVGERNGAGVLNAHVSIKVTALASQFVPEAFDYTYDSVAPRLREILLEGKKHQVFINVDAEHYHVRDLVFEIYSKVLLETPELESFDGTGIVVQAYLRDAYSHLQRVIELAKKRKLPMPVRLVKGAYWDAETIEARVHSYKAPQFLNKEETDIYYRQLVHKIFEASPHLVLCLASHNVFDHAFAEALRTLKFPHLGPIEHQCLHMTYEGLSTALARWNVPIRNYVPVGSLLVGMAYLVRRIMENSSQVGFLTQMRTEHTEKVLIPDQILERRQKQKSLAEDYSRIPFGGFESVAPVRLYLDDHRKWFNQTLNSFRREKMGIEYVNSFEFSGNFQEIVSPSDPRQVVGRIKFGDEFAADLAVTSLVEQRNRVAWGHFSVQERAIPLIRAAQLMLNRRLELAALIIMESGKSSREALADVDEAIDFLNLYGREEIHLSNELKVISPRGVCAVIAPWNFPIAIPCGMVAGALAAGNSVLLKSAEQTPLIAQELVDLLHEAGIPKDALIHLPGDGEVVGKKLVEDPRIDAIVFTGSKAVGTWIAQTAGRRSRDGVPTRVVTEMGGKNAIIITSSAELDETVAGTLYSAFAHAGQKCSALSRVLVDASVKDRFLERFASAAEDLQVGPAWDPQTFVNPVIRAEDQDRLRRAVSDAVKECQERGGKVWVDRSNENFGGFNVGPVVMELPPEAMFDPQSACRKEHFGPIVHVVPFRGLDEAIRMFNAVEYGLTGGVFSQSQDDIDYLLAGIEAGNLYVNRSCTGARVGIEPFGGFKLSGTGPKAGQFHYLSAFHRIDRKADLGGTISYGHREMAVSEHFSAGPAQALDAMPEEEILALVVDRNSATGRTSALWKDFVRWSVRHLGTWARDGEPNHQIPGQMSRDDFTLIRPGGVFVVDRPQVDYTSWQSFISALLLGMPIKVFLGEHLESEDRQRWRKQVGLLSQLGLRVGLWDETFSGIPAPLDTYIVDANSDEVGKWLQRIYDLPDYGTLKNPWMPNILTPGDGPHVRDYSSLFRKFVLVRSFAINTMRHGAPLS